MTLQPTPPSQLPEGTTLVPATHVTARQRTEEYLGGILNGESGTNDAKGELLAVMGFWNGKEYVRASEQDKSAITPESIQRISIDMPPDAHGVTQTRYFRQIAHTDGTENWKGMKATAWEEIDKSGKAVWSDKDGNSAPEGQGKQVVRVSFTGFLAPKDGVPLTDAIYGGLNPQTTEAVKFVDSVIKTKDKEVGKSNIELVYSSHSFGSVNARAARVMSDIEGVASTNTSIFIDPGNIGLKQSRILSAKLNDPHSEISKQIQQIAGPIAASAQKLHMESQSLNGNTLSINNLKQDKDGNWHTSHVANSQPEGLGKGLTRLLLDGHEGKDRVLEGELKTSDGPVVFQKVYDVKGYVTSSAFGKIDPAHQEVPAVASSADPNNYVVAVNPTPEQKATILAAREYKEQHKMDGVAAMSAAPVAWVIGKLGGNADLYIQSAQAGARHEYLENAKLTGATIASIFNHDKSEQKVAESEPSRYSVSEVRSTGQTLVTPKKVDAKAAELPGKPGQTRT